MQGLTRRSREAKDKKDPQLLAEAEGAVAFEDAGDFKQAIVWRRKSNEQAAKVQDAGESDQAAQAP